MENLESLLYYSQLALLRLLTLVQVRKEETVAILENLELFSNQAVKGSAKNGKEISLTHFASP